MRALHSQGKWKVAGVFIPIITAWKVSKYGVFSGPYFSSFLIKSPYSMQITGKYGSEKTPYLDTFHAVYVCINL